MSNGEYGDKKKRPLLWGSGIAVCVVFAGRLISGSHDAPPPAPAPTPAVAAPAEARTAVPAAPKKPAAAPHQAAPKPQAAASVNLAYGARGLAVVALQNKLIKIGCHLNRGPATGYFGPVTKAAEKDFEAHTHLKVDGVYDPHDKAMLEHAAAVPERYCGGAKPPAAQQPPHSGFSSGAGVGSGAGGGGGGSGFEYKQHDPVASVSGLSPQAGVGSGAGGGGGSSYGSGGGGSW